MANTKIKNIVHGKVLIFLFITAIALLSSSASAEFNLTFLNSVGYNWSNGTTTNILTGNGEDTAIAIETDGEKI